MITPKASLSGSPINITDMGRLCLPAPPAELQGSIYDPPLIMGLSLSITVKAHTTPRDTWLHSRSAGRAGRSHIQDDGGCQWRAYKWFLGRFEWFNISASEDDGLMVPLIVPVWNSLLKDIKASLWRTSPFFLDHISIKNACICCRVCNPDACTKSNCCLEMAQKMYHSNLSIKRT